MSKMQCLLALPLLAFVACSTPVASDTGTSSAKVVRGRGVALNRAIQQLRLTDGSLPLFPSGLKGTYGPSCSLHPGETWSVSFSDSGPSSLEVALNDTFARCPLTLTSVVMSSDAGEYLLDPSIVLGQGLASGPSSVKRSGTLAFYANAGTYVGMIAGTSAPTFIPVVLPTYSSDFVVILVYSDDPRACNVTAPPAIFNAINGVGADASVKPPGYDLDLGSLRLVVTSDNFVKGDSSGTVAMSLPSESAQAGEEWRVFEGTSSCCRGYTFATIDKLYTTQVPIERGFISERTNVVIPWSSFGLMGLPLPTYRTLIVKHTGNGGVYSYELFQVLFPGPVH